MLAAEATYLLAKERGNEHLFVLMERTLGRNLKPFMAEVYLVNAGIMASYIYSQRQGNLGDIIASATEALCRPGMLRYAHRALVEFDWDSALAITLRMEFVHESLTALFDVIFRSDYVGVDIISIRYRDEVADPREGAERFLRTVAELKKLDA